MVRKKWWSLYYSTYWCYIHQTCTNCISWHDLLLPYSGLYARPTFHAWVTMVWKKWPSIKYITYECYIHQTCTKCSSWHDLLLPHSGLCSWPTCHAFLVRKKCQVYNTLPMSATFTKLISYFYLDMIYWCHVVVCVIEIHFTLQWPRHKMAIVVPITIMSIICIKRNNSGWFKVYRVKFLWLVSVWNRHRP